MELAGATVLITGASRGIGEALAREFAKAGSTVAVAARSEAALTKVAADIGGHAFVVDLLDSDQVDGLVARVEAEVGPIDVLVNNAALDTDDQHAAIDPAHIRALARVNFEAPMVLTRHVLRGMNERGSGHLVFTSSLASTSGVPGMAAYAGSKAGINNFVASLRLELNNTNIKTTIIAPGPVDTRMWDAVEDSSYNTDLLKRYRMFRLIPKMSPERLAKLSVAAISKDRRHLRRPRRLMLNFLLPEAPRRLTEALLTGVKFERPPRP